jgi:hypothetical protein
LKTSYKVWSRLNRDLIGTKEYTDNKGSAISCIYSIAGAAEPAAGRLRRRAGFGGLRA